MNPMKILLMRALVINTKLLKTLDGAEGRHVFLIVDREYGTLQVCAKHKKVTESKVLQREIASKLESVTDYKSVSRDKT